MTELVKLAEGVLVEQDVLGIVQEIQLRWGDGLKLQYLGGHKKFALQAPYRIIEIDNRGNEHFVMSVWELDRRVIEKLEEINTQRGVDQLAKLELEEAAAKAQAAKEEQEWSDEVAKPLAARAVRDDKKFSFKNEEGELIVIEGDGRTHRHGN